MDNYIVINGKKAELTEEQLKKLGIKVKNKTPFKRGELGERFWYIGSGNNIVCSNDMRYDTNNYLYGTVNYFNNEDFAKQVALHQLLYRKLLKYAYENDAANCNWNDRDELKFYITKTYTQNKFIIDCAQTWKSNSVYFNSKDSAEAAIKDVIEPFIREHPKFEW